MQLSSSRRTASASTFASICTKLMPRTPRYDRTRFATRLPRPDHIPRHARQPRRADGCRLRRCGDEWGGRALLALGTSGFCRGTGVPALPAGWRWEGWAEARRGAKIRGWREPALFENNRVGVAQSERVVLKLRFLSPRQ